MLGAAIRVDDRRTPFRVLCLSVGHPIIPYRSFGESQNNQPIVDDQSMLRRLFPVWPISTAAAFCRTAEALQHSMLAIAMEQEFHFPPSVRELTHGGRNHARSVRARDHKDPEKQ
jgi:hypothetical protein